MASSYQLNGVEAWDGCTASAHALRQAQVDVVAAYPITPSTPIIQNYGSFKDNGYIDGEFVLVESEHAAMSACVGAAAAGGRVSTATSSQGFALMVEVLYQAAGMRLPIVLNVANRALASPLNIHCDHSDMYLGRDSGWINLCTCNPQEVYDFTLMAFKLAEHTGVRVPVMVHQDGFLSSHTVQNVRPLADHVAYKFVGDYVAVHPMFDFDRPVSYGAQAEEEWHFEHKAKLHHAIMESSHVLEEIFNDFAKITGRQYNILETFDMEDAEVAIFALGTTWESAIVAAKKAREKGIKAGVVTTHLLRPFPFVALGEVFKKTKAVAVMDKSSPSGAMGALFNEVAASLYQVQGSRHPVLSNYIYGLGGRDLTQADLDHIFEDLSQDAQKGTLTHPTQQFIGLSRPELSYF
ncbi:2-ketoisovalerate ferredoxin oxidoreductase subunit alpha [Helicobacter heilmannii]|uniref:Pyruvate:ferredoxin oxidoreductase, alpha subunit n=1 Tax=Helicobacter heilmannii TaxID=35817 RepID=A0A0K2Y7T8_HELHE|nr:2-oxoacid:ferredoxin oxidoreductase subunit alpha [Helicobacter heilmannii]BDQ27931.1 2-ketoisovalerate ferredoxin oxidoreductase subunit alpha [Helicobacter heilmannii]CRI35226.1 Pyruvate:ferredoxin oxidoreductase, alpha subunit [Helicobacter heilmannii]